MIFQAFRNNVCHHTLQLKGRYNERLRLFFISDSHARRINKKMIQNIGKVDAVIIGGDFCDKRTPIHRIQENITSLQKLGPIYFVWGNNDAEVGEEQLRELFAKKYVTVIENDAELLVAHNKIWLSAITDTSTKNYSFERAFRKCHPEDLTIFISHNPQVFHRALHYYKPDLMMGGHLHGGQIRLGTYGIHPRGSYEKRKGVQTLISNGYGTTLFPLRFGAKSECHVINISIEER